MLKILTKITDIHAEKNENNWFSRKSPNISRQGRGRGMS
jgi:hypothetical protein